MNDLSNLSGVEQEGHGLFSLLTFINDNAADCFSVREPVCEESIIQRVSLQSATSSSSKADI